MLLQLADIVFAYSYDVRTTFFQSTCESHWTVVKLSSTLSCFCEFDEVAAEMRPFKDVLISSYRRVLTYPLYRNFQLCEAVRHDTERIFQTGKVAVLKVLLNLRRMFERAEPKYLLNKLYIDDFAIWVQKVPEENVKAVGLGMEAEKLEKKDIGLGLDEAEEMYHIAKEQKEPEQKQSS